jgi:hypothetical protein
VEKRIAQRYDSSLLHEDLTRVLLVFSDKREIEANIVDISPQGFRVSIPPSDTALPVPQTNEMVDIFFVASYLRLTCRHIYSVDGQNNSLLMGFYVFDPDDQIKLRMILDKMV